MVLETLAVMMFGTNDGFQNEEIAAGIPCASFRYTEQGYEYRFVMALNGTKLLVAAMTDSTSGKYPDDAACRSIMNALSVQAQENAQTNTQAKNYLTDRGFYLQNGPLLVDLSENEYNIVYQDMPYDSLSVQRSGYAYDLIDSALRMGEGTDMMIWRLNENGLTGENAMVYIRAKEKKYDASDDSRRFSPADLKALADAIAEVMSASGTYDIQEINGIPYIVFPFTGDNQLRSAAVINGGYVYIYVKKTNPLTAADVDFLYTVLEHITVAD